MADDDLAEAERNARRLLAWAMFITMIALLVLTLDVMIKRQILEAAADAHRRLGTPGGPGQDPGHGASSPYSGLASMGPAPAPSADPDQDAGSEDD